MVIEATTLLSLNIGSVQVTRETLFGVTTWVTFGHLTTFGGSLSKETNWNAYPGTKKLR